MLFDKQRDAKNIVSEFFFEKKNLNWFCFDYLFFGLS